MEPLEIRPGIVIPAGDLSFEAVRASGPGGQNVNKVASKVDLRLDLDGTGALFPETKERLRALFKNALDADGRLCVTSQKTRDQGRNLEDARDKIRTMILAALTKPKARRKTRPTRGSVERRITEKKRRGETKAGRRGMD
ncbi:MAG: aminoacyl-tRNA hydrolase [Myxococcales bacterium]|nr:aminoacyl-tRNA hydrolase [Myxococcales bacterium]